MRWGRVVGAITALLCIVLFVSGTWASYWARFRNDQYQLIQVSQCVHDGGALYVDCWENKPPGLFWLNALALFTGAGNTLPLWIMPGVVGLISVAIMAFAIRETVGTAAACATAMIASAIMTLREYDAASINPDYYAVAFAMPAAGLWLSAIDVRQARGVWWRGLLAGLFLAAAALTKQTGALGVLALTLAAIFAVLFHPDYQRWAGVTAIMWLGFLLGVGTGGYALHHSGTLSNAYDAVVRFNMDLLTSVSLRGLANEWPRITQWCEPIAFPLFLGLVALFATRHNTDRRLSRPVVLALFIWWAAELIFALIGPSGSTRYVQGTFAAMSAAAAVGLSMIVRSFAEVPVRLRAAPVVLVLAVLWLTAGPMFDTYATGLAQSYVHSQTPPTDRDRLSAIGERVRVLVPDEKSAIYVWNYESGIYVYADRPCASAFTYPRSAEQMNAVLGTLREGKAKLLLIPEKGGSHFEIWCDETCLAERDRTLEKFTRHGDIGGYALWLLADGESTSESSSLPAE